MTPAALASAFWAGPQARQVPRTEHAEALVLGLARQHILKHGEIRSLADVGYDVDTTPLSDLFELAYSRVDAIFRRLLVRVPPAQFDDYLSALWYQEGMITVWAWLVRRGFPSETSSGVHDMWRRWLYAHRDTHRGTVLPSPFGSDEIPGRSEADVAVFLDSRAPDVGPWRIKSTKLYTEWKAEIESTNPRFYAHGNAKTRIAAYADAVRSRALHRDLWDHRLARYLGSSDGKQGRLVDAITPAPQIEGAL